MIPKEWLESKFWEPLVIPAIVVLVGVSAFALGRLSALAQGQGPLLFEAGAATPAQQ